MSCSGAGYFEGVFENKQFALARLCFNSNLDKDVAVYVNVVVLKTVLHFSSTFGFQNPVVYVNLAVRQVSEELF